MNFVKGLLDIEDLCSKLGLNPPYAEQRNIHDTCDCKECRKSCHGSPGMFDLKGFIYLLKKRVTTFPKYEEIIVSVLKVCSLFTT